MMLIEDDIKSQNDVRSQKLKEYQEDEEEEEKRQERVSIAYETCTLVLPMRKALRIKF